MTSREHGTQSCDGLVGLNGDLVCAPRRVLLLIGTIKEMVQGRSAPDDAPRLIWARLLVTTYQHLVQNVCQSA